MEEYQFTEKMFLLPSMMLFDNSDPDSKPIFVGSPFSGMPSAIKGGADFNLITTLDTNVLSYLRQGTNKGPIQQLLSWSAVNQMEINPTFGIAEQRLTHGNPTKALLEFSDRMKSDYNHIISDEDFTSFNEFSAAISPNIAANIDLFADYIVLIRYVFHIKGSFERRYVTLCNLVVENEFPYLSYMMFFAALYYLTREYPGDFDKKLVAKVSADMGVPANPEDSRKRLRNLAMDAALFYSSIECFRNPYKQEYNFSFIATADVTVGMLLKEIYCAQIVYNPQVKRAFPGVGLRPDGMCFRLAGEFIKAHTPKRSNHSFSPNQTAEGRRANLKREADRLFAEGR